MKIFLNSTLELNLIFKISIFPQPEKPMNCAVSVRHLFQVFIYVFKQKNWHRNSLILLSSKLCYVAYKLTKRRIKTTG